MFLYIFCFQATLYFQFGSQLNLICYTNMDKWQLETVMFKLSSSTCWDLALVLFCCYMLYWGNDYCLSVCYSEHADSIAHTDTHMQQKNSWTDPDACVGGIFDSSQKLVISGIEGNGECAVNNPTWQQKKSHYSVACSWQNHCWPTSILKHTGDY